MNFDTNGSISMFFAHCVATTTFLVQKKAAADHEYKTKISRDALAQVLVDGGRKGIYLVGIINSYLVQTKNV